MFPPFENESVNLLDGNHRASNLLANSDAVRLYALVLTENFEPLVKFCTKAKNGFKYSKWAGGNYPWLAERQSEGARGYDNHTIMENSYDEGRTLLSRKCCVY